MGDYGCLYNSDGGRIAKFDNISNIELRDDKDDHNIEYHKLINNRDYCCTINAKYNDNILYQLGGYHWYNFWRGDKADCKFAYN